jgi:thiamine biosynthesis protein ThiI
MNYDAVIVRYSGEIGIKSRSTRKWMENILTNNIRKKLEKEELDIKEISRRGGRIYIYGNDPKAICETVSNVFGVASTSPAIIIDSDMEEICKTSRKVAEEILDAGNSFRITTRRVDTHPFNSRDISIKAGAAVLDQMSGKEVSVNLNNPDKQIFIEIRHEKAYVYHEVRGAVGGMPTGTQGKIAIIISCDELGWIATFLMMKRGCKPVPVIFNIHNSLNGNDLAERIPALSTLKSFMPSEFSVFLVPFTTIFEELKQLIPKESLYLFCRKLQFQIAEYLCKRFDMKGIVTGDLLDRPENSKLYSLVDTSVKLPIYRPLIFLNAEGLTRYQNFLNVSAHIPCPKLSKDIVSPALITQFSDKVLFDGMVNRAIDNVIQKTV